MPETLFISDLHLDKERPEIIRLFIHFLRSQATRSESLYILGDLFEYWIGDDQPITDLEPVIKGLQSLTAASIPVYFIHGNRDFLIGESFAETTGIKLLPESTVIDIYGRPTLIMHGDTLCTDDTDYQKMRAMLRHTDWQKQFLSLSLEERTQQALQLRAKSQSATKDKKEDIMDVNSQAVEKIMHDNTVDLLIHGHTHRPAIHEFLIRDKKAQRVVLGDWYSQGSILRVTPNSLELTKEHIA
jgi:UDP-2,3-diacylglucosamine hydrolase